MSKRVFHHPPEPATGRKYWRSLGQLSDTPEFRGWLEREFPQGASEMQGGEVTRRSFLQLMGASTALAGLSLTSCRRPEKHLVPFTKGTEWSVPGKALFYSTSMPGRQGFSPLAVTTFDGRPTKIEGNPFHPAVKGASNTWAQTSILDLYDPERAKTFLKKDGAKFVESDEAAFDKSLQEILGKAGDGSGVAFLVERCPSPTRERLRAAIEKKLPKVSWCVYEASAPALAGVAPGLTVVPNLEKADVILAVDADFLSCSDGTTEISREFSSRRKVEDATSKMNRLYVVENRYTVTGGMADHRLRLQASRFGAFLVTLAGHIGATLNDATLGNLAKVYASSAIKTDPTALWIKETANDLIASKGRSLVLVGERQSAALRHLGHAINAALGNLGSTVIARKEVERPGKSISELSLDIDGGKIQTLFILGGNPVYNAPGDLDWVSKQAKVPTVIRLGHSIDETTGDHDGAARVTWQAPKAHYLEHWGDGIATDGSYVAVQPMILPLYGGWSEIDLLARVAGLPKPQGPELVQETFRGYATAAGATDLTAAWVKFLHDGYLAKSAPAPVALKLDAAATTAAISDRLMVPSESTDDTFELVFVPDSKLDDGRHANNGWLQELPDPITKLTWDNAALISPKSARDLGIEEADSDAEVPVIKISLLDREIEIAALIAPGHADNSITIPLGYGRTVVGRVGAGTGVNVFPLTTSSEPFVRMGARVTKLGRKYALAVTQEHGALEGRGGDITRESSFEQYQKTASAAPESEEGQHYKKMGMDAHVPPNVSLYTNPKLSDSWQWGMTVDLSACTGCSTCMVACQAENNIPIVGKKQVIGNREMHWIRTDRYFATDNGGSIEDPEMVSQPMMCQHCENAPCETVCPVNATVHSEDGLNVMAYNRCIGTRYCANNCPFKVRRFNFFDYNQRDALGEQPSNPFGGKGLYAWNLTASKGTPETIKMQKNPNVTVRMRGVMEKCTFCVQRIQEAKIAAKVHAKDTDQVKIPANSFTVACAQACSADAIVFGDINNPESRVAKVLKRQQDNKKSLEPRSYRLLEYLNVNTRVWYLARIRNPNNKMPDATKLGQYITEHHHGPAHDETHTEGVH
jgi:molybdopterin-containing oxidoreductase family iron-sulfur binding subunit